MAHYNLIIFLVRSNNNNVSLSFVFVFHFTRNPQVSCTSCSGCVVGRRRGTRTRSSEGMIFLIFFFWILIQTHIITLLVTLIHRVSSYHHNTIPPPHSCVYLYMPAIILLSYLNMYLGVRTAIIYAVV